MKINRAHIQVLIGGTISLSAILYLYFHTNWSDVGRDLSEMRWWALALCIPYFILHYYIRSYRWRYLLPEVSQDASINQLFDGISIGNFTSYILPFRLGEFVRPYVLSLWTDHTFPSAFVSVVIERFFDLSAVLLTFAIILPFVPGMPDFAYQGAISLGVLALAILVGMLIGAIAPNWVKKTSNSVLSFFPAGLAKFAAKLIDDLLAGVSSIKTFDRLFRIIVSTVLVWITCFGQFYLFLLIFPQEIVPLLGVTIGVLVALAVALPSAPGFIGVYQAGCVAAFALFNYPQSTAVAFSIVTHLLSYVYFIAAGFLALTRNNLSFKEVRSGAMARRGSA